MVKSAERWGGIEKREGAKKEKTAPKRAIRNPCEAKTIAPVRRRLP